MLMLRVQSDAGEEQDDDQQKQNAAGSGNIVFS